jgi:hypothetical protein
METSGQVKLTQPARLSSPKGSKTDANFSLVRRAALSLLKNNHTTKVGIKNKRLAAGWNDDYLAEVLFGV